MRKTSNEGTLSRLENMKRVKALTGGRNKCSRVHIQAAVLRRACKGCGSLSRHSRPTAAQVLNDHIQLLNLVTWHIINNYMFK
jgi:hypothetical protein